MATEAPVNADDLEPKKQRAIIALLNEPTVKKAAEAAGIGETTLHRWLDEPLFDRAYRAAQRKVFAQAISMAQKYAPMAVQCLAKIINDPSTPTSNKVQAAQAMLKFSRESMELDDLAARVRMLEASQEKKA